jgi:hypothetical protein
MTDDVVDRPEPSRIRGDVLGVPICEALGLDPKAVHRLEITLDVYGPATVTVHGYLRATSDAYADIAEQFATYNLVPAATPRTPRTPQEEA